MFLADATDLPSAMDTGKVGARHRLSGLESGRSPGHDVSPGGIVVSWDGALVCYWLAAEGQGAGCYEGFGCAVFSAGGVDLGVGVSGWFKGE